MFATANVTRGPAVFFGGEEVGLMRQMGPIGPMRPISPISPSRPYNSRIDYFPIRRVLPPPLIVRLIFLATVSA